MKGLLNLFWLFFDHFGGVACETDACIEALPAAIIFSTAWLKAGLLVLANELKAVV